MDIQTAKKIGEIMETAAELYRTSDNTQFASDMTFDECVGRTFWKSFDRYEQSALMQWVYTDLCDMGFTPLERYQNY